MKKLIVAFAFIAVVCSSAHAGLMLTTSNPAGSPLLMDAGSSSGQMLVSVISDDFPNDVMAAWQFSLAIVADSGATGVLSFQDPATGTPSPPPDYVLGSQGLGIVVTNSGDLLSANDFYDPSAGIGAIVPGPPGANLLQMIFLASANASGRFGIYALEGAANTQWTDADINPQFFTNVPDGRGMVRIGEVLITQVVPEPSSLILISLAIGMIAAHKSIFAIEM